MPKYQSSILKVAFAALFLSACASKPDPEMEGQRMLDEARRELSQKNFAAARDTIMMLRLRCPKALYATTSDANFGKPFQDRGGGIVKK